MTINKVAHRTTRFHCDLSSIKCNPCVLGTPVGMQDFICNARVVAHEDCLGDITSRRSVSSSHPYFLYEKFQLTASIKKIDSDSGTPGERCYMPGKLGCK